MGRPKKYNIDRVSKRNGIPIDCINCLGDGKYWGADCGACAGTDKERVSRALQREYNMDNGLPAMTNMPTYL